MLVVTCLLRSFIKINHIYSAVLVFPRFSFVWICFPISQRIFRPICFTISRSCIRGYNDPLLRLISYVSVRTDDIFMTIGKSESNYVIKLTYKVLGLRSCISSIIQSSSSLRTAVRTNAWQKKLLCINYTSHIPESSEPLNGCIGMLSIIHSNYKRLYVQTYK